MALTPAERQKRYRRKLADNGYHAINFWISPEAALALSRIAQYYRTTKQQVLERLLLSEQDRIMRDLDTDQREEFLLTKE